MGQRDGQRGENDEDRPKEARYNREAILGEEQRLATGTKQNQRKSMNIHCRGING